MKLNKKMSNDCLLLNGNGKPVSYFPLSTIDWKTAIRLLFTKKHNCYKKSRVLVSKIPLNGSRSSKHYYAEEIPQISKLREIFKIKYFFKRYV